MIQDIFKELDKLTFYLKDLEKNKVLDALKLSEHVHSNQLRKSGDPFIVHPLEVAKILTSMSTCSIEAFSGSTFLFCTCFSFSSSSVEILFSLSLIESILIFSYFLIIVRILVNR